MKAYILDIPIGGRFHLGKGSVDSSSKIIHADTLFSAITVLMARVYGAAERFIQAVREGQVRISSGLPALWLEHEPGKPVFFFPRPPFRYQQQGKDVEPVVYKYIKRIQFVSAGVLQRMLQDARPPDASHELPRVTWPSREEILLAGEHFALTPEELQLPGEDVLPSISSFLTFVLHPHVFVHKRDREDALFYTLSVETRAVRLGARNNRIYRGKGTYYFLVDTEQAPADLQRQILAVLRLLGDEGLGGEATSGYGHYRGIREVSPPEHPVSDAQARYFLSLAPLIPESAEAFRRCLYYDLVFRSGEAWARMNRRALRIIAEGALVAGEANGKLVEIGRTPDHPVYRFGKNFSWPLL